MDETTGLNGVKINHTHPLTTKMTSPNQPPSLYNVLNNKDLTIENQAKRIEALEIKLKNLLVNREIPSSQNVFESFNYQNTTNYPPTPPTNLPFNQLCNNFTNDLPNYPSNSQTPEIQNALFAPPFSNSIHYSSHQTTHQSTQQSIHQSTQQTISNFPPYPHFQTNGSSNASVLSQNSCSSIQTQNHTTSERLFCYLNMEFCIFVRIK